MSSSKEHNTQKRYLKERLEKLDNQDNHSGRSSRSIAALSDVEDEPRSRSRERGGNDVERLERDKAKYKAELKKYKVELRYRAEEHTKEMEKLQDYFQDQLSDLTEERDTLVDQVSNMRDELFSDKEKLRTEFAKKLATEKSRLETKYKGTSNTALKLQAALEKAQQRLNTMMEERDQMRDDYDNKITLLKEKLNAENELVQEETRKLRQSLEREREDIRRSTQVFQVEKDTDLLVQKREYDQKLYELGAEKDTTIFSLQHNLTDLKREKERLERDNERAIIDIKTEHELAITDRNRTIDKLKENHSRTLEQLKLQHEGKINTMTEKLSKDIQQIKEKHKKELEAKDYEYNTTIKNIRIDTNRQIEELAGEVATQKQIVDDLHNSNTKAAENIKGEMNGKIAEARKENEADKERLKKSLEREKEESLRERDSTIMELEKLNHTLGAQVGHYRSAMENMKTDTNRIKQQFVSNLNKQKEEDSKVISDRDKKIAELNSEVKNIQSRSSLQLEDVRNKLNKMVADIRNAELKVSKAEEERNDIQKQLEKAELQRSSLIESYEKRIERIKLDTQGKMNTLTDSVKNQYETKIKENNETINKLTTELDQAKKILTTSLNQQRKELITHSENENKRLREEAASAQKIIQMMKNELTSVREQFTKQLNMVTNSKKEEANTLREQLEASKQASISINQEMMNMRTDFTTKIAEITKKNIETENSLRTELKKAQDRENELRVEYDKRDKELAGLHKVEHIKTIRQADELLRAERQKYSDQLSEALTVEREKHMKSVENIRKEEEMKRTRQLENMQKSEKLNYNRELDKIREEEKKKYAKDIEELTAKMKKNESSYQLERQKLIEEREKIKQNLHRERKEAETKINEICQQTTHKEVDAMKADLADKTSQLEGIKKFSSTMKDELTRLTKLNEQLQNQLDTDRANFAKEKETIEKNAKSTAENKMIKIREDSLEFQRRQKHSLTSVTETLAETQKENMNMKEQLARLTQDYEELKKLREHDGEIDTKMRKMREDHIDALRKNKSEMTDLRLENQRIKREISMWESKLRAKDEELAFVIDNKKTIEASYVANLNAQRDAHGKLADDKDLKITSLEGRIRELEGMLSKTINKLTSS